MNQETALLKKTADTFQHWMEKDVAVQMSTLLEGTPLGYERFVSVTMNAFRDSPGLLQCTPASLKVSIVQAVTLGLEINSPMQHAAIVPFRKGQKSIATLIPMYQGYIYLALASGKYRGINARVVHEKDEFEVFYGTENRIHHVPFYKEHPGKLVAAYAFYETTDGYKDFVFLRADQVEAIRDNQLSKISDQWKKEQSPWFAWEEPMWRKTAVRDLAKFMLKTPRVALALELDNRIDQGKDTSTAISTKGFNILPDADGGEPEAAFEKPQPEAPGKPAPGNAPPGDGDIVEMLKAAGVTPSQFDQYAQKHDFPAENTPPRHLALIAEHHKNGTLKDWIATETRKVFGV